MSSAPPSPSARRLLVQIVADKRKDRELVSGLVAQRDDARVVASVRADHAEEAFADHGPNAVVMKLDADDDCDVLHAFRRRHPDAEIVAVIGRLRGAAEKLARDRVGQVPAEPTRLAAMLNTALDAFAHNHPEALAPDQLADEADRKALALLTPREVEVLKLTAEGLSLKDIAAKLHRAYGTVTRHRDNIMRKLQLNDRVALARFAIRLGLVRP